MTEWAASLRLAALTELSSDAVLVVDDREIIQWAGPAVGSLLGYSPDLLPGTRVADFIEHADADRWRHLMGELLARPDLTQHHRLRWRHGDGRGRSIATASRNLLAEPRIGALAFWLRAPEPEDPEAEDRRYRRLFEDAADIIFETDREGYFTLVNPAALALLGYAADEVIGRRFTEFVRADYRALVLAHYQRQIDAGERTSYVEFPAVARSGREVWVGQNAWLAIDEAGRYHGMRAVARDIGDRRRAEDALREAAKMEAVARLAGGIAHDFNNLLTTIRGNAELLLRTVVGDPARSHEVEEILHASDRAATMTRQLLSFSRRQDAAPMPIDVHEAVSAAARRAQRWLPPQIALEIDAPTPAGRVIADAAQLEQLVLILVLNARDALPAGGRITVRLDQVALPSDRVAAPSMPLLPGPYVRLQVVDNGIGMDGATQSRVFEPFFTTKEPGRGTGLGLSLVYGMVRRMGGAVGVASAPAQGATFSVFLPADPASARDDGATTPQSSTTQP